MSRSPHPIECEGHAEAPERIETPSQLREPYGEPLEVIDFGHGYSFVLYHPLGDFTLHKDGKPIRLTSKYNGTPWAACISSSDGNVLRDFSSAMRRAEPSPLPGDLEVAREILTTHEVEEYFDRENDDAEGQLVITEAKVATILARHREQSVAALQVTADGLAKALGDLVRDLEERAKVYDQTDAKGVVACGNGVWVRANHALETFRAAKVTAA